MPDSEPDVTLEQIAPGETVLLVELRTDSPSYRQSLYAMGLLPGTPIHVVRLAPLGNPMQIEVRGTQLSIRKSDAQTLLVKRTSDGHHA
jgi:ferrous iron transport protein A